MTLPSYAEAVLRILSDGEWHHGTELKRVSPWYMSLVSVLRRSGHDIERKSLDHDHNGPLRNGHKFRLIQPLEEK